MTDRPINFTAPMVRAILEGRKTQTRRVLRNPEYFGCPTGDCPHSYQAECDAAMSALTAEDVGYAPGDLLWVREAWRTLHKNDCLRPSQLADDRSKITYEADPENRNPLWAFGRYRHAQHMPRWASRITLRVTDVRVERLQDISRDDAIAEGIHRFDDGWHFERNPEPAFMRLVGIDPVKMYSVLWNIIHGPGAWDANPWVVAIGFERIAHD